VTSFELQTNFLYFCPFKVVKTVRLPRPGFNTNQKFGYTIFRTFVKLPISTTLNYLL
jgi:hypothetical protein